MNKPTRSDIAAFPELFGGMDQFMDELGQGIRRTSLRPRRAPRSLLRATRTPRKHGPVLRPVLVRGPECEASECVPLRLFALSTPGAIL